MNRAFRTFTIQASGTPQPLVGSYLTVAITQAQVTAATANQNYQPFTVTVADSSMFLQGDYILITDPSTYAAERGTVSTVVDGTHITVMGIVNPHPGGAYGTGAWVSLGAFAQSVLVQGYTGDSGTLYIGTSPQMVTSTGVLTLFQLATVATGTPNYFSTGISGAVNADTLSQYWIDGTTSDKYLPSIAVI